MSVCFSLNDPSQDERDGDDEDEEEIEEEVDFVEIVFWRSAVCEVLRTVS